MNMEDLKGKTVLITGCSSGIGKETAVLLAKRGARIVMGCRGKEKSEITKQDIISQSGNDSVVFKELDLASLQAVHRFAEEFNENEERLDILVNNAGVLRKDRLLTTDGHELHFGTNYLGHYLLTILLLKKLKSTCTGRIVIVGSHMYEKNEFVFDDVEVAKKYNGQVAYGRSKSAVMMFNTHLAQVTQGSGVTVHSVHPGAVFSDLQRDYPVMRKPVVKLLVTVMMRLFSGQKMISAEEAARSVAYCCVESGLTDASGRYYKNCKECPAKPHVTDKERAKTLWDMSWQMCSQYLSGLDVL